MSLYDKLYISYLGRILPSRKIELQFFSISSVRIFYYFATSNNTNLHILLDRVYAMTFDRHDICILSLSWIININ